MSRLDELAKKKAKNSEEFEEVKKNLFLVKNMSEQRLNKNKQVYIDLRNGFSFYGYEDGEVVNDLDMPKKVKKIRSYFLAKGCQTLDSFSKEVSESDE